MAIKKRINKFINGLNRILYESKRNVYATISGVRLVSSLIAIAVLVYAYGFEPASRELEQVFLAIRAVFAVFLVTYFLRLLYSFQRWQYIKSTIFEGILVLIIIFNALSYYLANTNLLEKLFIQLGFTQYLGPYRFLVASLMVVIVVYDIIIASSRGLSKLPLKPATTFISSFIILILIGTGLLMLPAMTVSSGSMPFLDALFTAVSASCVTGLIVVDTASYFTFKGQMVILFLIQLGGLGIVSFATFFATYLRQGGVGIKHQLIIQDFLSSESLFSAKGLLKQIIWITFIIEGIGIIFIFFSWDDRIEFRDVGEKFFFSVFHAVSAFCNAGFSLFSDNLYEEPIKKSYLLHGIILSQVILGGLGFTSVRDLFSPKILRERLEKPWKDWRLSTKISVYTSLVLLIFGALVFFILEQKNTLQGLNFVEATITSIFQSGITRTAGFNTVDISQLKIPTLILFIFLMFIGASSGSVGGGIKTSTFYLIFASVFATLRGRSKIEIGRRFIPKTLLFKALSIFVFAASANLLFIFLLSITEPDIPLIQLAFEQISAFGTVGLSTGITAQLTTLSKMIIIASMFLGRVGILTFALALSSQTSKKDYRYPKAHIMVG